MYFHLKSFTKFCAEEKYSMLQVWFYNKLIICFFFLIIELFNYV